jgi:large subunit ribosomal protein L10
MNREEKALIIDELSKKFAENSVFYITDGQGMTVAQVNQLRKLCYTKGIEYKVVKNTLIEKALEKNNIDVTPLAPALKGASGVLFANVANAPGKLLKEFYKAGGNKNTKPLFKGAAVGEDYYVGADQLDVLANLKSREEMIGEIIGLLQSPAKRVISALLNAKEKESNS